MFDSSWSISIISTDYDLNDIRCEVANQLCESGFKVLAFETPDFPVEPFVHSHDACLNALDEADIVVLIIDKRYGGLYVSSKDISITEQEYLDSIAKDKIVIPCVRRQAWDERNNWKKFTEQYQGIKYNPNYVSSLETIYFIDKVHKSDTDNFISFFDNPADLKNKLHGRLTGLSRYICERIVKQQVNSVKSTKTSTGMNFALGDVLEKGYFVDPPYHIQSGPKIPGEKISDILKVLQKFNHNILLLGDPGIGKSTLIAKAFIDHAQFLIDNKSKRIPFFLSLRSRGSEYNFNFPEYIDDSFNEFLKKKTYPLLDLATIQPVLYLDGFDELTEDLSGLDFQKIYKSEMLGYPLILSCRERYAKNYLDTNINFMSSFQNIIKLTAWGKDICKAYIEVFCEIHDKVPLIDEIDNFLTKSDELKGIMTNPLLITLFLWIVEEGALNIPLDITSKKALFEKCLEYWIKKELSRKGVDGTSEGRDLESLVRVTLEISAWEIYKSRFDSDGTLLIPKFNEKIVEILPESKKILDKEIFINLLDINIIKKEIKGMLHEFFLEHLVASSIDNGFQKSWYPFPNCLESIIRPEINQIIRANWDTYEKAVLNLIIDNLWAVYAERINSNNPIDIIIRNQATYYIGRIDVPKSIEILNRANEIEKNLTVKLSIAFGLIKKGDSNAENDFLKKLKEDLEWDRCNRGYHLIYYYDWKIKDSNPPYYDPEDIPWENTLANLLRHIESSQAKHLILRRVELFTIKRFIEIRKTNFPLDDIILNRIENAIMDGNGDKIGIKDFNNGILSEYDDLKKVYNDNVEKSP